MIRSSSSIRDAVLQYGFQSQRSHMFHVFSVREATPVDAGCYLSEVVHISGRWGRGTTVFDTEFASDVHLAWHFVRHQVAVTLDDLFLCFGVHFRWQG